MSHYKNISIEDYTYNLPDDRIAEFPLDERDASGLLVYDPVSEPQKDEFKNIHHRLPGESLMVFNNTRVVQARLLFFKETGARIEVFILEPAGAVRDIQLAFQQTGSASWFCLVGNAKKWKQGPLTICTTGGTTLMAEKGEALNDGFVIHFSWDDASVTFAHLLEEAGRTPLPPYIDRAAEESDKIRYQTIFARHSGSVAAPTAALHFSDEVMQNLKAKHILPAYVTLHVGAGTFKPVSAEKMGEHRMHNEQIVVHKESIKQLLEYNTKNIICVGTTSLRTLESLYWLGVKMLNGYELPADGFSIDQWEPYEKFDRYNVPVPEALQSILSYLEETKQETICGETSLIIMPGYQVRMADVLITNFHQPRSTLLLLVAAFVGKEWKKAYDFALANGFRFLSYGDSCLLFKNNNQNI